MKIKVFTLIYALAFICGIALSEALSKADAAAMTVLIEINGTINPATVDYVKKGLERAENSEAEALVILLDTPGGLLTSTQDIVQSILNARVPVIIYVSPSGATATSAGVFITLSAHVAAMAEGTSIGAAHPVSLGPGGGGKKADDDSETGGGGGDEKYDEKIENFASSFIESIAEKRKRNTKWAIEAVRQSASITATEALRINVIDMISPSLDVLLNDIDGREIELPTGVQTLRTAGSSIERLEMNFKEKLIDALSTPDIAFLLLSLGSLGLLIEFYNPGLIFPGVAGAISLLLGMVSLQILPFNYAGLALLGLSVLLLIAEIYVTSFGVLGIGGIISFILGALLLFDAPGSDVRVGYGTVIAAASAIGLFFFFVGYYLLKSQRSTSDVGYDGLLGGAEEGVAVTDMDKGGSGKIFIHGEYWNAQSEDAVAKGDKVRVIEIKKNFTLKVAKI
ncbi:MAG: NfeD family protein [Deltaproteobacteria bacterium]